MPATVTVKIHEGKHLPIMDRGGETTDAFVEVRLANNIFKTEVCRRTLNPKWDSDWFKFDVNDEELQEEPLQVRVMDYDTYSSHDAIGRVYVDLTNMLISENRSIFCGWLPIYDTLLGIRGQLKVEVRLHPFCVDMRTSWHFSTAVLFFSSSLFPSGFRVKRLIGLVDHSLVAEDPEHQWIDKIRTPRTTNEARQVLFMKMSGELRRRLGNKVVEMGGNAVLALRQRIDLGHIGVILRAIGTAAVMEKINQNVTDVGEVITSMGYRKASKLETVPGSPETIGSITIKVQDMQMIEADHSPITLPEGAQLEFPKPTVFYLGGSIESDQLQPDPAYILMQAEYPFFTLKHFPSGIIKSLGGIVSCRMTKTLDRLDQDDASQTPYAMWWKELRQEISRHMKSIGCNAVIGYSEELSLTDDGNIQLMSAAGTASVLDIPLLIKDREADLIDAAWNTVYIKENVPKESSILRYPEATGQTLDCRVFHLPIGEYSDHVATSSASCSTCKVGHVPDMLLTTIEPLEGMSIRGVGTLVQSRVYKKTKTLKGESGCRELSEALPFIEYDLHSQMSLKLKLLGFNAVFNLQIDIQCGVEVIVGCATGTGVCIASLPKPSRPTVIENYAGSDSADLQTKLDTMIDQFSRQLGLADEKEIAGKTMKTPRPIVRKKKPTGVRQYSKSTFLVDLEDSRSEGRDICSLVDFIPPKDTLLLATEVACMTDRVRQTRCTEAAALIGGRFAQYPFLQNFCRVWRTRFSCDQDEVVDVSVSCRHLLKDIVFRARMYKPCRISGLEFRIQVTPDDEMTIIAQGTIISEPLMLHATLRNTAETRKITRNVSSKLALSGSDDNAEPSASSKIRHEDSTLDPGHLLAPNSALRHNMSSAFKNRLTPPGSSHIFFQNQIQAAAVAQSHVNISSLSFVHSGTIKRYVGNLNLVALRECQSLKEMDGLSGFMQRALADFYAIVRAQTLASGGNTILTFRISQLQLADSYNQAQCIIHASGDMLFVEPTDSFTNFGADG